MDVERGGESLKGGKYRKAKYYWLCGESNDVVEPW